MSFEISAGLQNSIALAIIAGLNGSIMKIYGSPTSQVAADALIPADAHSSIGTATLLCTVSVDGLGSGVTFDPAPVDGVIYKDSSEAWLGENVASGYPSFYRLAQPADAGGENLTDVRVQGSVGVINKDLIIASDYLTAGQEQRVDSYVIGVPKE